MRGGCFGGARVRGRRILNLASISMVSKMKFHRSFFLQWDFHLSEGRQTTTHEDDGGNEYQRTWSTYKLYSCYLYCLSAGTTGWMVGANDNNNKVRVWAGDCS